MGSLPLGCLYSSGGRQIINTEIGSDKCYEEDKREYCQRECLGLGMVVLAREVRSGLSEVVTFEARTGK